MKKVVLIFVLLLVFFNQIGFQLIYWTEQIIIRKEQKELLLSCLPDHVFEKIEDSKMIQWEEDGKEFRFRNQMYDVARTIIVQGKKVYLVVNDSKENQLLQKQENTILKLKETGSNKSNHHSNFKYAQSIFTISSIIELTTIIISQPEFLILQEKIQSDYLPNILIPPPQHLV